MSEPLALLAADEARRLCLDFPPVGVEEVGLDAADGRVLAEDLVAGADYPAWARGVMDGHAVRARDCAAASDAQPALLRVIGSVPMGGEFAGEVAAGQAVAIGTGGVLPRGADAVVMIEHTRRAEGGALEVRRAAPVGDNVLQVGADVTRGERLLVGGRRLRPQDVAALAAFGVTVVRVRRRPRVAVLSTGNEVVPPAASPSVGQVRDMNQVALAAQAVRAGAEVTRAGIVRDDASELRARVSELCASHDALLISGGSSIGTRDLTAEVLGAIGASEVFHGINVRPGKPTILARLGDKPIFGMPGVPVSAMVIFDMFVAPLLRVLGGELAGPSPRWPARRRARMRRRVPSVLGREDYLRVRLASGDDGSVWADPIPGGSAAVSSLVRADGLVVVPASAASLTEGEDVEVLLYG